MKKMKVFLHCEHCKKMKEVELTAEMIDFMKRQGVETWVHQELCKECLKKLQLEDAQEESK